MSQNDQSRVSNRDPNPVREPLCKPVKEEDAQARDSNLDRFFDELLSALGFDANASLPAWWQGAPARTHVRRRIDDLGLSEGRIIEGANETRRDHPNPPDGPKALDRFMERAARRDALDAGRCQFCKKPSAAARPNACPRPARMSWRPSTQQRSTLTNTCPPA